MIVLAVALIVACAVFAACFCYYVGHRAGIEDAMELIHALEHEAHDTVPLGPAEYLDGATEES